jgi:hypothetical protein
MGLLFPRYEMAPETAKGCVRIPSMRDIRRHTVHDSLRMKDSLIHDLRSPYEFGAVLQSEKTGRHWIRAKGHESPPFRL